jgi:hypothetical protein
MSNLTFQYPAWFLLLCMLLGLGYALLLYFRDATFRDQLPWLHRVLGVLRFLSVTLIAALLLSPLLKRTLTETKKPIVVMAQDQSESVALTFDSTQWNTYKTNWTALRDALAEQYEVHELAFGDQVREGVDFAFQDKVTNLSELMQGVYDYYGGQNLGAVVLATDGIYNEGSNPAYSTAPLTAPVYAVALGDDTPQRDLLVKRVFHNKIAYLGDQMSLQIDVAATNCAGSQTVLNVSKVNGDQVRTLQTIPINIGSADFFSTKEVLIEADQPGVVQYRISVATLGGERSRTNNTKDIYIDVLDARQNILILANSPHPDVAALRQTLEQNKNYALQIQYVNDPTIDVSKADFVMLHNLPSTTHDISSVMNTLNSKRIPRLFVAGLQTNYKTLAKEQALVNVQSDGQQSDDVQAKVAPQFAAFSLDPRLVEMLPRFNPLLSAFGNFSATPQAQVLLWKRIGKVDTDQPLLAFGETNGVKTGILLAEGVWKWRLFDYLQHQNHELIDEFIGKTVQYLSVKEDKRRFRVTLDKNVFRENEPVSVGAELYNDNYELNNEPDVAMVIRHADGREFPYTFNKLGKAYTLNAGILPTGNYTFKAQTAFNGQQMVFEGRFSVTPIQLELFETLANYGVLRQMTERFGGEVVSPADLASLADRIKSNQTVKPVIYQTSKTSPLLNLKWIFAIIAGLLALEWFFRRYFGAY